jgi:hypothetical protein
MGSLMRQCAFSGAFSSRSGLAIPRSLSLYAGVHYRQGRSIFVHFHDLGFAPFEQWDNDIINLIVGFEFDLL